jgi:hypothetical protein
LERPKSQIFAISAINVTTGKLPQSLF